MCEIAWKIFISTRSTWPHAISAFCHLLSAFSGKWKPHKSRAMSFSTDSSFFFSGLSLRSFFIWCQFDRVCVCACSCACEESSFFHLPFVNACSPSFFNLSFVLFFIFNFFYFINLLVRPRVDETNEMKNKNQQFKIIAFPLYCVCVCWRLTRVSR